MEITVIRIERVGLQMSDTDIKESITSQLLGYNLCISTCNHHNLHLLRILVHVPSCSQIVD